MRGQLLAVAAVMATSALPAASAEAKLPPRAHRCPSVRYDGADFTRIVAYDSTRGHRTSCPVARRVVRRFVWKVSHMRPCTSRPTSAGYRCRVRARGLWWTCPLLGDGPRYSCLAPGGIGVKFWWWQPHGD